MVEVFRPLPRTWETQMKLLLLACLNLGHYSYLGSVEEEEKEEDKGEKEVEEGKGKWKRE